jgi:hypothetical protein
MTGEIHLVHDIVWGVKLLTQFKFADQKHIQIGITQCEFREQVYYHIHLCRQELRIVQDFIEYTGKMFPVF